MSLFVPNPAYRRYNNAPYYFEDWDPFSGMGDLMPAPFVANPGVNWKETPEGHVVEVQIPTGMKKEEVKVELEEGNVICVSGEKNYEKEEMSDHFYRVERSSGRFVKRYQLPEKVRAEDMRAHMENGKLVITVPKKEKKMIGHSKPIHIF